MLHVESVCFLVVVGFVCPRTMHFVNLYIYFSPFSSFLLVQNHWPNDRFL
jgi:hypothetical protein